MRGKSKQRSAGARKRRPAKQQAESTISAEEIVQQEVRTPTNARVTLYCGAVTVNIEVSSSQ
jgi:hypothetical protein